MLKAGPVKEEGTPKLSVAIPAEVVSGEGAPAVVGVVPFIRRMGVDFAFLKSRDDAFSIHDDEVSGALL